MARISKFFSQRPQVQERTTSQIFETLKYLLETDNIAVSITGKHYCMLARGVEDSTSATVTNKFGGEFKTNHSTRAEFLNTLRNQ
jgi:GTP cyclohydrolase I